MLGEGAPKTAKTPDNSRFRQEPWEPGVNTLQKKPCRLSLEGWQVRAAALLVTYYSCSIAHKSAQTFKRTMR